MFNSYLYNQSSFNSSFINILLNNYIEDLEIQISSVCKIRTDYINKFLRVNLKRNQPINIILKRNILNNIELEKPVISLKIRRKIFKKICLNIPRFKINLQRIGER